MSDNRPSSRRRISPAGALAAAAALGAGLLVAAHFAEEREDRRDAVAQQPAPQVADPTPQPVGGTLPAVPASTADARGGGGSAVGLATGPISLRYTFDGGVDAPVTDASGRYPLRAMTQNGGELELIRRDAGLSVQYPTRCRLPEKDCPRAILEGSHADALNPGTRPLRYGASVLMTHADLADGANVLQKGYSVGGGSQFKLQVDHRAGHPSCVIAARNTIYRVEPKIDVADGRWHELACTRSGSQLTMTVDGVEADSVSVPPAVSIANAEPLRIGG
ncbi:MAG TPA: LamG-like jellyroll fold domain-containing protein [Actinoplanes sp.]